MTPGMLCALHPVARHHPIMQICVERTCLLAVTSLLVAFHVWGVGSGKPAYIAKPHGVPTTTKEIPDNE